ncbi:uncharacterized protein TrAFT101_005291 [Trichoderma asperellum]|uniref:uncharacterized protein n=1 Tax=Trichoderma asperellum TaxID=101201 RepID=UPI003316F5B4|nr:hypothetical protein TrAFT101_005291 [Trichoderma asperellum]
MASWWCLEKVPIRRQARPSDPRSDEARRMRAIQARVCKLCLVIGSKEKRSRQQQRLMN